MRLEDLLNRILPTQARVKQLEYAVDHSLSTLEAYKCQNDKYSETILSLEGQIRDLETKNKELESQVCKLIRALNGITAIAADTLGLDATIEYDVLGEK